MQLRPMRIAEQVSGALKTRIVKALTPSQYEFSFLEQYLRTKRQHALAEVIQGVKFVNGVKQNTDQKQQAV